MDIQKILEECKKKTETLDENVPRWIGEKITARVRCVSGIYQREYERFSSLQKTYGKGADALAERLLLTYGEDFWKVIARRG